MALHVIVGKGPVGSTTAQELVARGHTVRVLSRSGGTDTGHLDTGHLDTGHLDTGHLDTGDVEHRAVDATDVDALTAATHGAAALYNAVNPPYDRWASDWPPIARALLATAERTGAVLVTMSNLYAYGRPAGPMTTDSPLAATDTKGVVRRQMWLDSLAAHEAGRIRMTEARAADFVGPQVPAASAHLARQLETLRKGSRAWVIGDPDAPRSWAYLPDVAATLATLGTDERALGRAWHVPVDAPRSQREALTDLAAAMGRPAPKVSGIPWGALRVLGLAAPVMREIVDIRHQFDGPFVTDSTATTAAFGLEPTPWADVVAATTGVVRAAG